MLERILADMLMKALYCIVGRDAKGHCERYHIVAILDSVIRDYNNQPKDVLQNESRGSHYITTNSYKVFQRCRDDLSKQGF